MVDRIIDEKFDEFRIIVDKRETSTQYERTTGHALDVQIHLRKGDIEYIAEGHNVDNGAVNECLIALHGLIHDLARHSYSEQDHYGKGSLQDRRFSGIEKLAKNKIKFRVQGVGILTIIDHSGDSNYIQDYICRYENNLK